MRNVSELLAEFRSDVRHKDIISFVDNILFPAICKRWYRKGRVFWGAIKAQVKSGKRIMKQYLMLRLEEFPKVKTIVLTALNLRDCKAQKDEYERKWGLEFRPIFSRETAGAAVDSIEQLLSEDISVLVFLDECDHGSGQKQLLSSVMSQFEDNTQVCFIGISATVEELWFSDKVPIENQFTYIPSKNHCGAKWYLEQNLVREAEAFIEEDIITEHGIELLENFSKSNKSFMVVRTASGLPNCIKIGLDKASGTNETFLRYVQNYGPKIENVCVITGEGNAFDWGDKPRALSASWKNSIDGHTNRVAKTLFIIVQTARRSTEIGKGFLKRLYAWHDYRSENDDGVKNSCYNTMAQAMLRPSFFLGKGDNNVRPLLYVHEDTILLAAGEIVYSEWRGRLSCRMTKGKTRYHWVMSIHTNGTLPDNSGQKRNVHLNKENIYRNILNKGGPRSTNPEGNSLWFLADVKPKYCIDPEIMRDYLLLKEKYPEYFGKYVLFTRTEQFITAPTPNKHSAYSVN